MEDFGPSLLARAALEARNRALQTNPPHAINNITRNGSNWLWAVMALHGFLFLAVLALTLKQKHQQRVFHYIALALLLVPTIAYYTMASNLGSHAVPVQFREGGIPGRTRQIFWVRFVEWFVTWSLEVLALLLLSGVGWSTILFTIGLTMLQAVMYLVGALTRTSYKWGYYAFAVFLYFLIAYQLFVAARAWARKFDVGKTFSGLTAYLLFFWLLYPISWGLSEGGNVISNDSEQIFYGILDIFSKGLFALALVWLARKFDYKRLGLEMGDHGRIHDYDYGPAGMKGDTEKVRSTGAQPVTA